MAISFQPREFSFRLACSGSIPGSDEIMLVRAFRKAGIRDGSMPWDFNRSIRSGLRSSIKVNHTPQKVLLKAETKKATLHQREAVN